MLLQAERALDMEEVGYRQLEIAGGAHRHAQVAIDGQASTTVAASGDLQFCRPRRKIDHQCISVAALGHARDPVHRHLQAGGGGRDRGHAHQGHLVGARLERGPLQPRRRARGIPRPRQRQREFRTADAQPDRVGVHAIGRAVPVGIGPIRAADTHEGVEAGAAEGQHVGDDGGCGTRLDARRSLHAVRQCQRLTRLLDRDIAFQVDEAAHLHGEAACGTHHFAQTAVGGEFQAAPGAGDEVEGLLREIDDQTLVVAVIDLVDRDRQITGSQNDAVRQPGHQVDPADARLQRRPRLAVQRVTRGILLARLGGEQGQTELDLADAEAARLRIDRAVFEQVGAHADKAVEARAADGQDLGIDLGAIGQHDRGRGTLEGHRALEADEVGDGQGHIGAGADQPSLVAVHVEREPGPGAGDDLETVLGVRLGEIDDLAVGVEHRWHTGNAVDRHGDIPGAHRQARNAHHPHLTRTRLQRRPAHTGQIGLRRVRREQGQTELDIGQAQADGVGVDHDTIALVWPPHPCEGIQTGAAHAEHPCIDGAAVGQRHLRIGHAESQRTADEEVVTHLEFDITGDHHLDAVPAVEAQALRGSALGLDIDGHRRTLEVDDTASTAEIDRHRQVLCRSLDAQSRHADRLGRGCRGLQRQPGPLAVDLPENTQGGLDITQREADRIRRQPVGYAIAIGVCSDAADLRGETGEGTQPLTTQPPGRGVDVGAIVQRDRHRLVFQHEGARRVEEIRRPHGEVEDPPAVAEVLGIEVGAQRIVAGRVGGCDVQVTDRHFTHLQRQPVL